MVSITAVVIAIATVIAIVLAIVIVIAITIAIFIAIHSRLDQWNVSNKKIKCIYPTPNIIFMSWQFKQ